MPATPTFDLAEAHRFFSAHCFNAAWDLIEKPSRTPEEDRLMVAMAFASIYHWSQRPDLTPKNLSVGYWQASRVLALSGDAAGAQRAAETSLAYAEGLGPFLTGYAHEALARAAAVAGDHHASERHLETAAGLAEQVEDADDKALLMADLAGLR